MSLFFPLIPKSTSSTSFDVTLTSESRRTGFHGFSMKKDKFVKLLAKILQICDFDGVFC